MKVDMTFEIFTEKQKKNEHNMERNDKWTSWTTQQTNIEEIQTTIKEN